jgi:hypothetical protein
MMHGKRYANEAAASDVFGSSGIVGLSPKIIPPDGGRNSYERVSIGIQTAGGRRQEAREQRR